MDACGIRSILPPPLKRAGFAAHSDQFARRRRAPQTQADNARLRPPVSFSVLLKDLGRPGRRESNAGRLMITDGTALMPRTGIEPVSRARTFWRILIGVEYLRLQRRSIENRPTRRQSTKNSQGRSIFGPR